MSEFVTHKEHAKELKEYKKVIDDERHDWIKERIQPNFTRFDDKITKNEVDLAVLKQSNMTTNKNISEIKESVHWLEKKIETFLLDLPNHFATKAEHKENSDKINWVIKLIWTFWVAIILWGWAFIFNFLADK